MRPGASAHADSKGNEAPKPSEGLVRRDLVEADVQRVIARSFWGVENVEEASLTFAAFKDEWWPSDEDRRAWGPLAEKKRRERALEKKERERLRREYEAEQARKRRELTKQMTKALNDVLNTSGIANSIDRARARRVLHVLLFGTRKTVTLYGDIPPAGKGRPTCPLRVRLAHARQRVIDAYCSHRGLEAEGGVSVACRPRARSFASFPCVEGLHRCKA